MPSAADYALWLMTTMVELLVVSFTIVRGQFRKFPLLNLYLLGCIATSITRYVAYHKSGLASRDYVYSYYFSDATLSLLLFLSVCELAVRLIATEMRTWKIILLCASVFVFMAGLSISEQPFGGMHLMVQFSEHLFDACLLGIAALLCFWSAKNRVTDRLAVRLVMVLSVYFCLILTSYKVHEYFERANDASIFSEMAGAWLPLGCGFVLLSDPRRSMTDAG